jgi:hypothetical protein
MGRHGIRLPEIAKVRALEALEAPEGRRVGRQAGAGQAPLSQVTAQGALSQG